MKGKISLEPCDQAQHDYNFITISVFLMAFVYIYRYIQIQLHVLGQNILAHQRSRSRCIMLLWVLPCPSTTRTHESLSCDVSIFPMSHGKNCLTIYALQILQVFVCGRVGTPHIFYLNISVWEPELLVSLCFLRRVSESYCSTEGRNKQREGYEQEPKYIFIKNELRNLS